MTKDQMVIDLACQTRILFWISIYLGKVSIDGKSGGSADGMSRSSSSRAMLQSTSPTQTQWMIGSVPDGHLLVICLMRRGRSTFVPCGHLVCRQRCALSVEREVSPKCSVVGSRSLIQSGFLSIIVISFLLVRGWNVEIVSFSSFIYPSEKEHAHPLMESPQWTSDYFVSITMLRRSLQL
ncbi:hypothetical protein EUGRSUZ_I00478 [Eucalyptus grandis]|uniref:Uncharacterized protein n=2 Tax=Eucalyptus grandis TaxID=71139 RepID=A0ACC3JBT5_EUCGR|nr:hypothetical protein EUGRSUZ_I00478 [Eucalyptus grandis]